MEQIENFREEVDTDSSDADVPLSRVDLAGGADRSAALLLCEEPLSELVVGAAMALPRDTRPNVGSWLVLLTRLESAHRRAAFLPLN